MPEKERSEKLGLNLLDNEFIHDNNGGITPLEQETIEIFEKGDNNLLQSNLDSNALKEENLIANKSLKNLQNKDFEKIKKVLGNIFFIKKVKDNNILSSINIPYIKFLFSNNTLKQTILPTLKENVDKNPNAKKQYSLISKIPIIVIDLNYKVDKDNSKPLVYTKEELMLNMKTKKQKKKSSLLRLSLFFITLLVIFFIGYRILLKGIYVESLQISNIKLDNVFLQLQNKLILEINSLKIVKGDEYNESDDKKSLLENINSIVGNIQKTLYALSYFKKLEIKNLYINEQQWEIHYTDSSYIVNGPTFNAIFDITNNKNNLYLKINKFQLKNIAIHLEGDFIYSIPQKQFLFNINSIKNENEKEQINLNGYTDFDSIIINGKSTSIKNLFIIKPFIDNIEDNKLRLTLQNWIFNNIKYSSFSIPRFKMNISLNNIGYTLLHNTMVDIDIKDPEVTLAKDLKPIKADKVLLEFKDTNLKIQPIQANFAGMDLSGSEVLIANMPHSDVIIDLNGKDVRIDSNLKKLIEHYGIDLPLYQKPITHINKKKKSKHSKDSKLNNAIVQQAINNTESIVTKALNTSKNTQPLENQDNILKAQIAEHSTQQKIESMESNAKEINNNLYDKILELNPNTTLTNELLYNPNYVDNELTSMHIKISIKHNEKKQDTPLFYLQGIIQAQNTELNLYNIPLKAKKMNVALDITPSQKIIYINGNNVKWNSLVNADINAILDVGKGKLQANTYIHQAILNTTNLKDLKLSSNNNSNNKSIKNTFNAIYNKIYANQSQYSHNKNEGIYLGDNSILESKIDSIKQFKDYNIMQTNANINNNTINNHIDNSQKLLEDAKKQQQNNIEIPKEIANDLPKQNIKDNGDKAKHDDKVLKTLKNNPVWNDLKIRTKKTQPFIKLTNKELENLALKEIEKEKDIFHIEQDFLNIKKSNIDLTLSFSHNKIILDVPTLSIHLESDKDLKLKISKIENILQFSPLANYYGITHGNLDLNATQKNGINFILNIINLKHPIYTINHKRVSEVSLKGKLNKDTLIIIVNDDIDFKSQESLSMLRIKGYRIDVDEAYKSNIPFFVDLLKDKQIDALPYSEEAINQELRLIDIKNKLRKKLKINPTDFNIIGENLQLTFLGYTIPFDIVNIRFIDNRIIVDGQYEKGILNASMIKDNIKVSAKNFSGNFVNIVLTSTKDGKRMLEGGTFSLDGLYSGGILNAALEIQNTSLIDFKSIQNIFALIDTVPSLFMFKDPHISTTGYQVNYGKILFAINNDYIGLQNIFLLGSSMDINGQGIIDIDSKETNVNLNISTIKNLSKFINKIPIIGYLILGREGKISTNLILTGKYDDPKVNITLATDIIKAPFNILRRVFPIEMLINNKNNEEELDF